MDLVISRLSKSYPNGVRALDNVSLTIPTGMFGLLGRNGAGKSTVMRTIATLQEPDRGAIRFGSVDVVRDWSEIRMKSGGCSGICRRSLAAQSTCNVVSTRMIVGKPMIYVYSDICPASDFTPVAADLADAYFYHTSSRPQIVAQAMDLPHFSPAPQG